MRYFIEEQADWEWDGIKQYILDIKDFTKEALIDEIIKNIQKLRPDSDYPFNKAWIKREKEWYNTFDEETLITKAVEEKFYILDDDDEHAWNKQVVQSVIDKKPWIHRWDKTEIK